MMYYEREGRGLADLQRLLRKIAVAKAGPGVVTIITHNLPGDIMESLPKKDPIIPPSKEYGFVASGIILECQSSIDVNNNNNNAYEYLSTVLVPASLFKPYPPGVDVDIDVIMADRVVSGFVKLLACDFHYNLATLTIVSETPLPTVTLRKFHDIASIHPNKQQQQHHSDLFQVKFGVPFFTATRMYCAPYSLDPGHGTFCSKTDIDTYTTSESCRCDELYCIQGFSLGDDGGPVLNSLGEVVGIISNESFCLPSNLIIRWWNAYKTSREFRRPFVGVEVTNLAEADLHLLADFILKFPNISSTVIVTEVMEDSAACRAGIQTNDVIMKFDGKPIRCKSEFYDSVWDNVGKTVTFSLIRSSTREELNVTALIEDATPDKFYKWPLPAGIRL